MARKQPVGSKAFDRLMQGLVQVPKKDPDRAERRYRKRKAKRRGPE